MTTVHADASTVLANLAANRRAEQAEIFGRLTDRLAMAGAAFVAVTSIAGHCCRKEFADRSSLPEVDLFESAARKLMDEGAAQAILLGGTDLVLAFDSKMAAFPVIDCAAINVHKIAQWALDRQANAI